MTEKTCANCHWKEPCAGEDSSGRWPTEEEPACWFDPNEETAGKLRVARARAYLDTLLCSAQTLRRLAGHFRWIGMSHLDDVLTKEAANIESAANDLHECWSKELDERFHEARQNSLNLLKATLAGMVIGDK